MVIFHSYVSLPEGDDHKTRKETGMDQQTEKERPSLA